MRERKSVARWHYEEKKYSARRNYRQMEGKPSRLFKHVRVFVVFWALYEQTSSRIVYESCPGRFFGP